MVAKKKVAKKKVAPKPKETVHLRSERTVSYYANNTTVERSPWDFRMRFGELVAATESKVTVAELVSVIMSPPHFKATVAILLQFLKDYEKDHGEIKDVSQKAKS